MGPTHLLDDYVYYIFKSLMTALVLVHPDIDPRVLKNGLKTENNNFYHLDTILDFVRVHADIYALQLS